MKGAASFCGIITLQVGAAVLAVIFFTLAGLILVVNAFDYYNDMENDMPMNLILLAIFLILMIVLGIVMFFAAYNEHKKLSLAGMVLGIVLLLLWLVLSILSWANDPGLLKKVCIHERCPESLWLVDLKYRGYWRDVCGASEEGDDADGHKDRGEEDKVHQEASTAKWPFKEWQDIVGPTEKTPAGTGKWPFEEWQNNTAKKAQTATTANWPFSEWDKFLQSSSPLPKSRRSVGQETLRDLQQSYKIEEPQYVMGLPLIGAILLFIANLIFFIFTAFIMWSYYKELSCFVELKDMPYYG